MRQNRFHLHVPLFLLQLKLSLTFTQLQQDGSECNIVSKQLCVCVCVLVCVHACMCVCMRVCVYAHLCAAFVCGHVHANVWCVCVWMYGKRLPVSASVCMHVSSLRERERVNHWIRLIKCQWLHNQSKTKCKKETVQKQEEQNLMLRDLPFNFKTKEKKRSHMHLSHKKRIMHDLF